MSNVKIIKMFFVICITASLVLMGSSSVWAHGSGTKIVPQSLSMKAGSEFVVTVSGLTGSKTATFKLTGISGKFELGEFQISSDDFTQVLKIPVDLPPGSYRLTVEGGKKKAKVVINVN